MDPDDQSKLQTIIICEGDEPNKKAQEFADEHGLGEFGVQALEN